MGLHIFNNSIRSTETITAQSARVLWGTGGSAANAVPLYMLGLTIQYQQASTPMYPLYSASGEGMKLIIKGAAEGTLTCQGMVVKSTSALMAFLKAVSKDCKGTGDEVTMSVFPFGSGCNGDFNQAKYTLNGVDLNALTLSIQAGQVAQINHSLQFTFSGLQIN